MDEPNPKKGLTLVEAAFWFVSAVAIGIVLVPSLFRSRITANESSAIASLKTLVTAQEQYKSTGGDACYAPLSRLSGASIPYIDRDLGSGKKRGYCFVLVVGTPADSNWYAEANPIVRGKTGNRNFFVDSSGVIRFALDERARSASFGDE